MIRGTVRSKGGGGEAKRSFAHQQVTGLSCFALVSVAAKTQTMADAAVAAPAAQKAPPKFKQRTTRTFKSKAPKPGQKG